MGPHLIKNFKTNFVTGILALLPFLGVMWFFLKIWTLLTLWKAYVPDSLSPHHLLEPYHPFWAFISETLFTIAIVGLILLGIAFFGSLSRHYFGKKILTTLQYWIQRVPVLRSIYSTLSQLIQTIPRGDGTSQFHRVVYVEYPRKGIYTIAFVTKESGAIAASHGPHSESGWVHVYIPTTPNPTSGFYLMYPRNEVIDASLSVESALKTILSLGLVHTEKEPLKVSPHD